MGRNVFHNIKEREHTNKKQSLEISKRSIYNKTNLQTTNFYKHFAPLLAFI